MNNRFAFFSYLMVFSMMVIVSSCGDDDKGGTTVNDNTRTEISICPDDKHPHLIDMGLPSGTKWACCNIGASSPCIYGSYFSWGETTEKSNFTWQNYKYYNTSTGDLQNIGSDICGSIYDAAYKNWGGSWRMPSVDQVKELVSNSSFEWVSINGVEGYQFTSKSNGNKVFFPATGTRESGEVNGRNYSGYYWTGELTSGKSNQAQSLYFYGGYPGWYNDSYLYAGQAVRAVVGSGISNLKLSSTSPITLNEGETQTIGIQSGSGIYTAESSNYNVATAKISNASVVVTAVKSGETTITVKDTKSGQTASINVTVLSNLILSSTSPITLNEGEAQTIGIQSGSGSYTAESSNNNVATAKISNTSVIVTAVKSGAATITVKDTKNGQTASISVTVKEKELLSCPDNNHPHAIDLGLPSGTKWACCNVGAGKPEGYGGYYAWGETEKKDVYNEVTYQYCTGNDTDGDGYYDNNVSFQNLGSDIAGTQYDVAHVKWGGSWVMPSFDQMKELFDNTTRSWTTLNGINGCLFKGTNGGCVFLPAAGSWYDYLTYVGNSGDYWSGTQSTSYSGSAYDFGFNSVRAECYSSMRSGGRSIRPVSR